jgi:hypothetical protein
MGSFLATSAPSRKSANSLVVIVNNGFPGVPQRQLNVPAESRFEKMHKPVPSHNNTLADFRR